MLRDACYLKMRIPIIKEQNVLLTKNNVLGHIVRYGIYKASG